MAKAPIISPTFAPPASSASRARRYCVSRSKFHRHCPACPGNPLFGASGEMDHPDKPGDDDKWRESRIFRTSPFGGEVGAQRRVKGPSSNRPTPDVTPAQAGAHPEISSPVRLPSCCAVRPHGEPVEPRGRAHQRRRPHPNEPFFHRPISRPPSPLWGGKRDRT